MRKELSGSGCAGLNRLAIFIFRPRILAPFMLIINAITQTIPSSASAVATPANATLVLTGDTAMGLMLLATRRK